MTIGIVGLGLIGGSLGMAMTAHGSHDVIGYDAREEAIEAALSAKAIDRAASGLKDLVTGAELIILATPISAALSLLPSVMELASADTVVTDVCSTKGEVMEAASDLMKSSSPCGCVFIGGHPMSGSERAGIEAADPYLFENALYILTPPPEVEEQRVEDALARLRDALKPTGAHILLMPAEKHDSMASVVSHLPHLVAVALIETLVEYEEELPGVAAMAAGGFRDTTRVASGDPLMWRDIFVSNAEDLSTAFGAFLANAEDLLSLALSGTGSEVQERLKTAALLRDGLPQNRKGLLIPLHELIVTLKDEPGRLAEVTGIMADAGINIKDIEVLKIREGEGGTLRLGFMSSEDADRGGDLLEGAGYKVRRR